MYNNTSEKLKLCKATKVKVFSLVLVYVFNFDLLEFSAAILEKGLFLSFFFGQSAHSQATHKVGATEIGPVWNMHLVLLFANLFNDLRN